MGPFTPHLNVVFGRTRRARPRWRRSWAACCSDGGRAREPQHLQAANAERSGSLFFAFPPSSAPSDAPALAAPDGRVAAVEADGSSRRQLRRFPRLNPASSSSARAQRRRLARRRIPRGRHRQRDISDDVLPDQRRAAQLRNTTDVTAKLLTAGSGTGASPAHALATVQEQLAEYTSRAAGVEHSIARLTPSRTTCAPRWRPPPRRPSASSARIRSSASWPAARRASGAPRRAQRVYRGAYRATRAHREAGSRDRLARDQRGVAVRGGGRAGTTIAPRDAASLGWLSLPASTSAPCATGSTRWPRRGEMRTCGGPGPGQLRNVEGRLRGAARNRRRTRPTRSARRQRSVQVGLSIALPLVFVCTAGVPLFIHGREIPACRSRRSASVWWCSPSCWRWPRWSCCFAPQGGRREGSAQAGRPVGHAAGQEEAGSVPAKPSRVQGARPCPAGRRGLGGGAGLAAPVARAAGRGEGRARREEPVPAAPAGARLAPHRAGGEPGQRERQRRALFEARCRAASAPLRPSMRSWPRKRSSAPACWRPARA